MAHHHIIQRRVEFSETDMAGIMHYSNYFRFMETAEHSFYRSLGFSVILDGFDPPLGFPRVHAECDFRKPLKFEDVVEVELRVKEIGRKKISYQFLFRNLSSEDPTAEVARGLVTIVCVSRQPDNSLASTLIPESISKLIRVAPEEI